MKKIISLFLLSIMLFSLAACGDDTPSDIPEGMKLASDTEIVDYLLYVPEDWEITSKTGMTMAQASMNDDSNVIVTNFTAPSIPPYANAQNSLYHYFYGEKFLQNFFEGKNNFAEVEAEELAWRKDFLSYAIENKEDSEEGFFARLVGLFDMVTETDAASGESVTKTSFELLANPTFITVKKGDNEVAALTITYSGQIADRAVKQQAVLIAEDDYFYVMTFSAAPSLYEYAEDAFAAILKNFEFED